MKIKLTILSILILGTSCLNQAFSQNVQKEKMPEMNVLYGDKHIFTIETPDNWVNDKENAQKVGLVVFFYPITDTSVSKKTYVYANGYDKASPNETLDEFIKADLKTFGNKYPNFEFKMVKTELTGGVKNGKLYSFSNLKDRYKEEVLYTETEATIIVFSFSARTENDYKKYQPVFDKFVKSFNYRGDNPKPFLDYMNNKNK